MSYSIYFYYKTTGKRDDVTFVTYPEFLQAYNSLTKDCKDFITVTSTLQQQIKL